MSMSTLNDDVLREIFLHLPVLERVKIRRVCKRWRKISDDCWRDARQLTVQNRRYRRYISTRNAIEGNRKCFDILSGSGQFILGFTYRISKYIEFFCEERGAVDFSIMQGLKKCRKLKSLSITVKSTSDHHRLRQLLAANQRIRNIDVSFQSDECLLSLPTGLLEEFTLQAECTLGVTVREKLRQCRSLKKLQIYADLDEETAEVIGRLQSLKFLTIIPSSAEAANRIATSHNLEQIAVTDLRQSVTAEFFSQLSRNSVNLKEVKLESPTLTDEDLQPLSLLPHLQELQIVEAERITGTCLINFNDVPHLFINAPVLDEHVIPLLRSSPRLRRLHLYNTLVTVDVLQVALEEVLKREDDESTKNDVLQLYMEHLDNFVGPLPRLLHKLKRPELCVSSFGYPLRHKTILFPT